ncbi:hypothetical protein CEXT_461551, partial [Caerostris extrusa]
YRKPGQGGKPHNKPLTGVPSLINVIYNYFAVGGHLTGIPPLDLLFC